MKAPNRRKGEKKKQRGQEPKSRQASSPMAISKTLDFQKP
jgi:hypothetical protein